jgi:1,4-dihydroxy-2-naphthoate octaprenyltransferase
MQRLLTLLRLSRPYYLVLSALSYALGAGIARYLGNPQIPAAFWLGLGWTLLLQLSMILLAQVFRPFNDPLVPDGPAAEQLAVRNAALWLSTAALASAAALIYWLFIEERLSPAALLFVGLSVCVALAYAVPPIRLVDRGFGELLLAFQLASISPFLGFLFQAGEAHRLVGAITFPLTVLALALFIVLDFPTFASDSKYGRVTLLARLGWERAVPLHHALVLTAYVMFAAAPLLLGFSLNVLWPAFLTLPFGLLQIYWLRNIALGAKPVWPLLTANAIAVFGLTAYLLTLTFWLR